MLEIKQVAVIDDIPYPVRLAMCDVHPDEHDIIQSELGCDIKTLQGIHAGMPWHCIDRDYLGDGDISIIHVVGISKELEGCIILDTQLTAAHNKNIFESLDKLEDLYCRAASTWSFVDAGLLDTNGVMNIPAIEEFIHKYNAAVDLWNDRLKEALRQYELFQQFGYTQAMNMLTSEPTAATYLPKYLGPNDAYHMQIITAPSWCMELNVSPRKISVK